MHAPPTRWKSHKPGGLDKLNLFYTPDEFDGEFPLVRRYTGDIPQYMIPFGRKKPRDRYTAVHFFLDDYRFERIWNRPVHYANVYAGHTLLSPDFSVYADAPVMVQKWNVYRSRWLSSFFATRGINIIPVATWGDKKSYEWCFNGIEYQSVIAISTRGCWYFKQEFSDGVDAMMDALKPTAVLCCGEFKKFYVNDNIYKNIIEYWCEWNTYIYRRSDQWVGAARTKTSGK